MSNSRALVGAARYEFSMQLRRRALWLVVALLGLAILIGFGSPGRFARDEPADAIGTWAWRLNTLLPVALAVLLADRLPRDRQLGISELLASLGQSGSRLGGKFLGATIASLVPVTLLYAIGVAWVAAETSAAALTWSFAAYLLIVLPAILFVGSFAVALPALIPLRLFQVGFAAYWLWGNLLNPEALPTLNGSWLTPVGSLTAEALFGVDNLLPRRGPVSNEEALASIAFLLALTPIPVVLARLRLRAEEER